MAAKLLKTFRAVLRAQDDSFFGSRVTLQLGNLAGIRLYKSRPLPSRTYNHQPGHSTGSCTDSFFRQISSASRVANATHTTSGTPSRPAVSST